MEAELIAWDSYARELERADAAPARSSTRLRLKQLMRERHELQQRLANAMLHERVKHKSWDPASQSWV